MFSSDQKFIVSGDNKTNLKEILKLALFLEGGKLDENNTQIKSFCVHSKHGLILGNGYGSGENFTKYPMIVSIDIAIGLIDQYLQSNKACELRGKLEYNEYDGGVHAGWEVYIPQFENFQTIIAIKPIWVFYAK